MSTATSPSAQQLSTGATSCSSTVDGDSLQQYTPRERGPTRIVYVSVPRLHSISILQTNTKKLQTPPRGEPMKKKQRLGDTSSPNSSCQTSAATKFSKSKMAHSTRQTRSASIKRRTRQFRALSAGVKRVTQTATTIRPRKKKRISVARKKTLLEAVRGRDEDEDDEGCRSDTSSLSSLTELESSPEPTAPFQETAPLNDAAPPLTIDGSISQVTSLDRDLSLSSVPTLMPTSWSSVSSRRSRESSQIAAQHDQSVSDPYSVSFTTCPDFDMIPRHPTYWQLDGSVIIHVQPQLGIDENGRCRVGDDTYRRGMLFKLQKSTLIRRSKYFERLFADTTDHDLLLEGCEVVRITGNFEDFANVLDAIEDGGFKLASSHSPAISFPNLVSLLRGASFFEIESLKGWAKHAFERMWPEELDGSVLRSLVFSLPNPGIPSPLEQERQGQVDQEIDFNIAIESVGLAMRFGVKKALKRAVYDVVRHGIVNRMSPPRGFIAGTFDTRRTLSVLDIHTCYRIQDHLLSEWLQMSNHAPDFACSTISCLNYTQLSDAVEEQPGPSHVSPNQIPMSDFGWRENRDATWTRAVHQSGLMSERMRDCVGGLAVLEGWGSAKKGKNPLLSDGSDSDDVNGSADPTHNATPTPKFVTYIDWESLGWCEPCVIAMVAGWRKKRKQLWKDIDQMLELDGA